MIGSKPKFWDSPFFDFDSWKLKAGAPKDIIEEFEEYNKAANEFEENNKKENASRLSKVFYKHSSLTNTLDSLKSKKNPTNKDKDLINEIEIEIKKLEKELIDLSKKE